MWDNVSHVRQSSVAILSSLAEEIVDEWRIDVAVILQNEAVYGSTVSTSHVRQCSIAILRSL